MPHVIVDRRLNPKGKNLSNRQAFLKRAKDGLAKQMGTQGTVTGSGSTNVRSKGLHEPSFRHSSDSGEWDHLLPGNKEYVPGDTIQRPPTGGGGAGSEGSPDGEGEDDFRFALSREEYLDLFLSDLELPDMIKEQLTGATHWDLVRAGYTNTGSPANLSVSQTTKKALKRRIALRRPKPESIAALKEEIEALKLVEDEDPERLALIVELEEQLALALKRTSRIPWIDTFDTRYRLFDKTPRPVSQAVMFCLMDVSGSMTEHMKDLAKRFYVLLKIFLDRKYERVDVVFIRHTHMAQRVDEETFFNSPETGGTVVSTGLEEVEKVIREEPYDPAYWNIYVAQCSDGDNTASDNEKTSALLTQVILPKCQYYAYIEVGRDTESFPTGFIRRSSDLWQTYESLANAGARLAMKKVGHRSEIYPVFRELFAKKGVSASG